jgi:hypothetical protein
MIIRCKIYLQTHCAVEIGAVIGIPFPEDALNQVTHLRSMKG